jgi:hypothetical protein
MLSVCEVIDNIQQILPAPNNALVHRVMGWGATKVQSTRTWMRNFAALGVATQIKPGEYKNIDTKIKPGEHKSITTEIKSGEHKSIITEIKPGERKRIATAIKSGERKSMATEFKSSQLPEAIEARGSILYVIDNDKVFRARLANLPQVSRTSYTPTTLTVIKENIVPAFDRVSRLNPSIADSLKRILDSLPMTRRAI